MGPSWLWATGPTNFPIKAAVRSAIGKGDGDEVTVHLTARRN